MSKWKVMAAALTLSLGGVAYVAGPMNNRLNAQFQSSSRPTPQATEPAPAGTTSNRIAGVPTAPETIPPELLPQLVEVNRPTPQSVEFDLPINLPGVPVANSEPTVASAPDRGPETLPVPREMPNRVQAQLPAPGGSLPFPLVDLSDTPLQPPSIPSDVRPVSEQQLVPPTPVTPPMVEARPLTVPVPPMPMGSLPTAPRATTPTVPPSLNEAPAPPPPSFPPIADSPRPQPQPLPEPAAPLRSDPPAPPRATTPSAPPSFDPAPVPPPAIQSPPQHTQQIAPASVAPTKLRMLMRLGDGRPRFEIREQDSAELLFKVYGDKVEMQQAPQGMKNSPIAGVTAVGKVRFVGPGIEGTCDQLSVLSGTGEVLLKGNVSLKTKKGKTWSEMTAEKMIYQIGTNGLTTASSNGVRPASYSSSDR